MICPNDIATLKTDINEKIGQKIIVKGSLGRSKSFEKEATIQKAYPSLFVIKYTEENRNVKCDVAFVPVGGTFTMDYREAAKLINEIKPKIAVPTHYGSIVGDKEDGVRFANLIERDVEVEILMK